MLFRSPELVGWHQLVGGIQGPQVHFDFVGAASEDGGTAAGTEKPPGVVACFAVDRHRTLREHRGRVKQGPMMLAAVETVKIGRAPCRAACDSTCSTRRSPYH